MILNITKTTKKKKIFRGSLDCKKSTALYLVTTYWFLFIPIYRTEEFL